MDSRERSCANAMAEQLRPWFAWVTTSKTLSKSRLARATGGLARELGYVPVLQPDIDICLKGREGQGGELCGIELKVVRRGGKPQSFYSGIDQALALQRYGLDHVALWVAFEDVADLRRLSSVAWWFLRNEARLEVDFAPYLLTEPEVGKRVFRAWQYEGPGGSHDTGAVVGDHSPCFRHDNPLLQHEDAELRRRIRVTRDYIERWVTSKLKSSDFGPDEPADLGCAELRDRHDFGPTGPAGPACGHRAVPPATDG
jgi:hypothetical protein